MADFPQFEWMEIDGRMVPSVKPQHYKKGSTKATELTGHDNPLPVANYSQSDSGIWLPTSKDNPMPTQVTGSIVEVLDITDLVGTISANSQYRYTIPSDFIGKFKYVTVWFRRDSGEFENIILQHWTEILDRFGNATSEDFEYNTSNKTINVTNKKEVLTSRQSLLFVAGNEDLVPRRITITLMN